MPRARLTTIPVICVLQESSELKLNPLKSLFFCEISTTKMYINGLYTVLKVEPYNINIEQDLETVEKVKLIHNFVSEKKFRRPPHTPPADV